MTTARAPRKPKAETHIVSEAVEAAAAPTGRTSNQRYSAAMTKLRETHLEEFEGLLTAEYEADGEKRRPSAAERDALARAQAEEKAKAKLEAVYAEFPHLRPAPTGEDVGFVGGDVDPDEYELDNA